MDNILLLILFAVVLVFVIQKITIYNRPYRGSRSKYIINTETKEYRKATDWRENQDKAIDEAFKRLVRANIELKRLAEKKDR